MKRPTLNFAIDAVAFAGFVLLATTGVLMRYILPPGSGRFLTIWGLDRHEWGQIHFWISFIFLGILAVHLVLHWRWILNVIIGRPREGSGFRAGLGIVGLLGLLALSISPLLSPVETSYERTDKELRPSEEKEEIFGSMTLVELEDVTNVPLEHVITRLQLPPETDKNERLGTLKREYGFTMEDVRRIVREYKK
jgi:hypothetical protein